MSKEQIKNGRFTKKTICAVIWVENIIVIFKVIY